MSQTELMTSQPASAEKPQAPQIAGNLWWDDVRQGMGLLFVGFLIYLVPFLFGRYVFIDAVNLIFHIAAAVVLFLGLKLCLGVPPESGAAKFAVAAFACALLAVIGFAVGIVPVAPVILSLAALVLVALFIRACADYLGARSLALLSMQYAIAAGLVSVAVVVASVLGGDIVARTLTLLLVGVQLFLIAHLYETLVRMQRALAPESPAAEQPSGVKAAAEAAAHTIEDDPLPVVEPPYFNEQQWDTLQTADKSAGRAVVGLMTAIFLIGVVLYTIIAVLAA